MRIGIITNHYLERVGGAEEALDRLASHWHVAGEDVVLFSIRSRKARRKRLWQPAYAHVRLGYIWSTEHGLGRYVRAMRREHARRPFDAIFACDAYWAGHVARMSKRETGVPYAVWSQGGDVMDTSRFLRKPVPRRRMAEAIGEADAVLCISQYVRRQIEAIAEPRGLVAALPNGWPDEWANVATAARPMAGRYIFAMGRLVPLKGFGTLLQAFAQLRPTHRNVRLVIAGEGAQSPQLLEQAQQLDLTTTDDLHDDMAAVCFPGFVQGEAKRALIEHAAIGVSPSIRNEPMSLALFEMLCRGVPVVASRVGGTPDVVQPGVNGLLFEAGDAAGLARAMDGLLSDQTERHRLAAAAAGSVAEHRWGRIAERALTLLSDIVERAQSGRAARGG